MDVNYVWVARHNQASIICDDEQTAAAQVARANYAVKLAGIVGADLQEAYAEQLPVTEGLTFKEIRRVPRR